MTNRYAEGLCILWLGYDKRPIYMHMTYTMIMYMCTPLLTGIVGVVVP
jgi:hypothetical protein